MGLRQRLPSRDQISRWTVYALFAGLFISLPAGVITAPRTEAASFGTIYNAPEYFFGGGTNTGVSDCAAGQVVVGITFNQNAMSVGKICAPLLADYTIAALTTATRNTAGYVFCPDGMAAVGTKYFSSGGLRAGLLCKTPPLVNDSGEETQYVASAAATPKPPPRPHRPPPTRARPPPRPRSSATPSAASSSPLTPTNPPSA